MATPHGWCGGSGQGISPSALSRLDTCPECRLVKALIMSTSQATSTRKQVSYTPRQQGAGIVDTAAAISTGSM